MSDFYVGQINTRCRSINKNFFNNFPTLKFALLKGDDAGGAGGGGNGGDSINI